MALREVWDISGEDVFNFSDLDWLLILLDQLSSPVHEQVILIFWRACHLRNYQIFGKVKKSIATAANVVENY